MVLGAEPAWHWPGLGPGEQVSPKGGSVAWPPAPGIPVLEKSPLGTSLILPSPEGPRVA